MCTFISDFVQTGGGRNKKAHHCDPYMAKIVACMARIVPNNPFAFPPSVEVSVGKGREHMYVTYGSRATHSAMARIVPNNPFAFPPSVEVSAGSTIPGMESVESSLEQRPRTTQEQLSRSSCRGCGSFAERSAAIFYL